MAYQITRHLSAAERLALRAGRASVWLPMYAASLRGLIAFNRLDARQDSRSPAERDRRARAGRPRAPSIGSGASCSSPGVHYRSRRSEEHTSELQSLMRITYAVFCL